MADLPLSATLCECGTPNCDSFECCEPAAYVEAKCVIKPVFDEVCIDYGNDGEYVDEEYIEAILVDSACSKAIITHDCRPLHVRVKIN